MALNSKHANRRSGSTFREPAGHFYTSGGAGPRQRGGARHAHSVGEEAAVLLSQRLRFHL